MPKTVLVTGAHSGIGLVTVLELAAADRLSTPLTGWYCASKHAETFAPPS